MNIFYVHFIPLMSQVQEFYATEENTHAILRLSFPPIVYKTRVNSGTQINDLTSSVEDHCKITSI